MAINCFWDIGQKFQGLGVGGKSEADLSYFPGFERGDPIPFVTVRVFVQDFVD
jgi:hypothetical protein